MYPPASGAWSLGKPRKFAMVSLVPRAALGMQRGHPVKLTWGLEPASVWTWRGHLGLSHSVTVLLVFHTCCSWKVKSKPRGIVAKIPLEHGKVQGTKREDKLYSRGVGLMMLRMKRRHSHWESWVLVYSSKLWFSCHCFTVSPIIFSFPLKFQIEWYWKMFKFPWNFYLLEFWRKPWC